MKVTGVPAQTEFWPGVTVTLTGRFGLTVMVIPLDVAGLFEMQTVRDDVSSQVTISVFTGV